MHRSVKCLECIERYSNLPSSDQVNSVYVAAILEDLAVTPLVFHCDEWGVWMPLGKTAEVINSLILYTKNLYRISWKGGGTTYESLSVRDQNKVLDYEFTIYLVDEVDYKAKILVEAVQGVLLGEFE